ncbi:transposon Tf2-11 polyprotein [Trichonephila inaurata madagascariensis]|uniref:Transposon Tf2-11 polyprotein n=1 Tax=Trichonephila inaurata madagascariensis TaxID=2747483 RepID=A0A8X7BT86_9ARAC|nr:transposon Tf2-11 polyprotein [Trichonephila inaurata madagascariensis]
MQKDISNFTRSCLDCQKSKVASHNYSPLKSFQLPSARFDHIHLDLVRPLPPSNNCEYLLTSIERFTRWSEAIPISDICAETAARAFITQWISRFGLPSIITTDLGRQFESILFSLLSKLLGVQNDLIPPSKQWNSRKIPSISEKKPQISCIHEMDQIHSIGFAWTPNRIKRRFIVHIS